MSNLIIPGQEAGIKDPVQARLDERKREEATAEVEQEMVQRHQESEQEARARATRKVFKGIYSRHELVLKAKVGMSRIKELESE